jgi:hypothetical protein
MRDRSFPETSPRARLITVMSAVFILFAQGCYVEKMLPAEEPVIGEHDHVFGYVTNDGRIIEVPSPGLRYEDAYARKDSLCLVMSGRIEGEAGRIFYDDCIPLADIRSVRYLPSGMRLRYGTLGAAYGTGFHALGGFTYIDHIAGFCISGRELVYRATDLPDDYTGLYQNDNITMFSTLVVIGGHPSYPGKIWLGLEFGPSYIIHRKEVETPNPAYGEPWAWGILPDLNKYIRDNVISHGVGLTGRFKFNLLFSKAVGLELALFGNLNRYKPCFGFDCCLMLGKLK